MDIINGFQLITYGIIMFFRWLFNLGHKQPKYQNIPYYTRTGMVIPESYWDDDDVQQV